MRRKTVATLAAGLLVLATPPAALEAQAERTESERCTCESPMRLFWRGPQGASGVIWGDMARAQIGVALGGERQDEFENVGAYVQGVSEDSPAEEAGLREGDVITAVDGHSLMSPLDADLERDIDEDGSLPLQRLLALAREWEPGDQVDITYQRDGSERTARLEAEERRSFSFEMEPMNLRLEELGERMRELAPRIRAHRMRDPGDVERIREPVIAFSPDGIDFMFGFGSDHGLELKELNPELGRYFGADRGVLVLEVSEDSELGLRAGDVIQAIDGRAVDSPRDVRRILRSYDDDEPVTFEVRRDGNGISVEGSIS